MWNPLAILTLAAVASLPQEARNALEHYNLGKESLGVSGYDPVSYFKEGGGKPEKGRDSITLEHRGVGYRFASAEHRDLFRQAPGRYEPAYGGWCAWAMSDGADTVEPDPESFLIEEGQLLLFYDGFFADTRKSWKKAGGVKQRPLADTHWKKLSGESPARDVLHWSLEQGVALGGFDPTRYRDGSAQAGKATLPAAYGAVTYHFASAETRALFLATPSEFEPYYGGWCAQAMARGERIKADPQAFRVEGRDLFVFVNAEARDAWKAGAATQRKAADKAWRKILSTRG